MENEISKSDYSNSEINSVEGAVQAWIREQDLDGVVNYLKNHREDIGEFCMQTYESFQKGDVAGIYHLGMLIDKLIK